MIMSPREHNRGGICISETVIEIMNPSVPISVFIIMIIAIIGVVKPKIRREKHSILLCSAHLSRGKMSRQ